MAWYRVLYRVTAVYQTKKTMQLAINFQKFYSKLLMDYWSIFENIFSSLFSDVDKASQIKSFWIHSDIMGSKYMYVDLNLKIP